MAKPTTKPSYVALSQVLRAVDPVDVHGRVLASVGLCLRATIPGVRLGDCVTIARRAEHSDHVLLAEVVGFVGEEVTLMPLGSPHGVGPGDLVRSLGKPMSMRCSDALLGCVVDGLGNVLGNMLGNVLETSALSVTSVGRGSEDGRDLENALGELGELHAEKDWDLVRSPPPPLKRPRICRALSVGVRAIDGLLTVGEGQRVGIFAGSGAGKSALLGQIARQSEADVFVVCLVGERGREVREFLENSLGWTPHASQQKQGVQKQGVVVCATSDEPALLRMKCAHTATAIAEWFRDQGKRVLLLMDSVTRFARAAREVGLAAGEPPARRGYPPSVFAHLPALLERSGNAEKGSITAFYTVLVEGGDLDEPIADEVRGVLDGHIVLSRAIGERGRWPAIDVARSLSRVMDAVTETSHQQQAAQLRAHLSVYEAKRDLVDLGAYKTGTNPALDTAMQRLPFIQQFLCQGQREQSPWSDTRAHLAAVVADATLGKFL